MASQRQGAEEEPQGRAGQSLVVFEIRRDPWENQRHRMVQTRVCVTEGKRQSPAEITI